MFETPFRGGRACHNYVGKIPYGASQPLPFSNVVPQDPTTATKVHPFIGKYTSMCDMYHVCAINTIKGTIPPSGAYHLPPPSNLANPRHFRTIPLPP